MESNQEKGIWPTFVLGVLNQESTWQDDPEKWKYHRSHCRDGCFSQVHQEPLTEETDIWLKSGEGFMTEKTRYAEHLASAEECKDVSQTKPFSCSSDILSGQGFSQLHAMSTEH